MNLSTLLKADQTALGLAIITSLMFICVEILQDNIQKAQELLRLIQRLIKDFDSITSVNDLTEISSLIKKKVLPLVVRLAVTVASTTKDYLLDYFLSLTPTMQVFSTLEEARTAFYPLTAQFQTFIRKSSKYKLMENRQLPIPPEILAEQSRILDDLRTWHAAFMTLLTRLKREDQESRLVALLLAHHDVAFIWISSSCTPYASMFDQWTDLFRNIVHNCEIILAQGSYSRGASSRPLADPVQRRTFILDAGIISNVYYVVLNCRHPGIRRKALHLMRFAAKREGIWKSDPMARVAQTIMEEEEGGGRDYSQVSWSDDTFDSISEAQRLQCVGYRRIEEDESDSHCWLLTFTRYTPDEYGELRRVDGSRPLV